MRKRDEIEIMAPVGSWDSLTAAFQAKADAVYFGIEQLNMRARSSINFSIEDLGKIVNLCKENGVKSYLTLNTVLYDYDIPLMKRILDAAKEANIDSVIAMDHSAIQYANSIGLTVHISTQINITNIETLKFYSNFAETMVLSRELTLSQIKKICTAVEKENITGPSGEKVRIEVFVHGALCMAISGKCYLSLGTHNSSANRGACKQNCRRPYTVKDSEGIELLIDNEYIMSPKDLNTISFMDKLLDTGISVLKIEGRSKGPDYVHATVNAYRDAVDSVYDGSFSSKKVLQWMDDLDNVYNRGFWGGYFLGKKLGEWTDTDGNKSKRTKQFLGVGVKYYSKIEVGEFILKQHSLSIGDKVMLTGPTTGVEEFVVETIRVEDENVEMVERGIPFSMPLKIKVRSSDKLYKIIEKS